jgi:anion-transporting  ArsA/GET3 family ATPase
MSTAPPALDMKSILADKSNRVVVCCGAGGVGKTTTAAAIAVRAAEYGRTVVVLTIDPAKRLAQALGIRDLGNEPQRVPLAPEVSGELHAMMLDMRRTFDDMVIEHSGAERAQAILDNQFYQTVATSLAGTQEYMAMEKLGQLLGQDRWDLVVVDTPPSRNALDFLEAPGRLTSFLEGRTLKAFMRPTGVGMRVLGRGAIPLLGAMRRITGIDLLADLSTFFQLLGDMTDDFSARARQVQDMLTAETTAFLLVTSAQAEAIDETIWFRRTLEESGLPFAGAVVNRVHHDVLGDGEPDALDAALAKALGPELATRVAQNFYDYHVLARRDAANIARLEEELDGRPMVLVPHLDGDVHDIEGLLRMHRYLFASDAERERLIADLVA